MSFSLLFLVAITLAYLASLFFSAYLVERKLLPAKITQHPFVYVLAMGVYVSAWAFYGTVGLAYQTGYAYLAYYLGAAGAFMLAPILLKPLLRLSRNYQLSSLADMLAFRYRSRLAGVSVTLLMLCASIPLLTLQITAVVDTLSLLNQQIPASMLALPFCVLMILFAILFGARHISPRSKHTGLVFALACETIFKVLIILALSAWLVFDVFGSFGALNQWISTYATSELRHSMRVPEEQWHTMLLMCFAAIVTLPHMFHVIFTENVESKTLKLASWGMPIILFLVSISIPPIVWAGIKLNIQHSPEYLSIHLGQVLHSPLISLLGYLGGLAAASGVIVVVTLALAAMCLNHLVMPVYRPKPEAKYDIYHRLLWLRRVLIAGILLVAYGFYAVLGTGLDITRLGLISFAGVLQFLPGVLGLLYWPKANRIGFLYGLFVGATIWFVAIALPIASNRLGWHGLLNILPKLSAQNWHLVTLISLAANFLILVLVSLFSKRSHEEVAAAEVCSIDSTWQPVRQLLKAKNSNELIDSLSESLGRHVAQREVLQALKDLNLPSFETRPFALRQTRDKLEANLSGLMGPTVAHSLVSRHLPLQEHQGHGEMLQTEQHLDDFQKRFNGLAGELDSLRRHYRKTLEHLPLGTCSLAQDGEILLWNQAMRQMTGLSPNQVTGTPIHTLPEPWRKLFVEFVNGNELHLYKHPIEHNNQPYWFNLHKAFIQAQHKSSGDLVILLEDQSANQRLENKLMHSERLASIGRLSAGIAHEIGNPITGIDCLAQSIRYETKDPTLLEMAEQIKTLTQRINRILQSLSHFSYAPTHSHEYLQLDLRSCVHQAVELLKLNQRMQQVRLNVQLPKPLPLMGDSQRLIQVFVNLISNAIDASGEQGVIHILDKSTDNKIRLAVQDEGEGIPLELQSQIFEPFFTTKDVGKGTGLGLPMVYNIVTEHAGKISVHSPLKHNLGTSFILSFNRITNTSDETQP